MIEEDNTQWHGSSRSLALATDKVRAKAETW
jgi:hypothetical protein